MSETVHVATIVSTRGRIGEVAAICPSGRPERLRGLSDAWLEGPAAGRQRRSLRRTWVHRGRLILHFEGVDDISEAERLVGQRVLLDESELPPLPEGEYYAFDLEGLEVVGPDAAVLGRVVDVKPSPAQDLLVVETPRGRALVPMTAAIVRRVDLDAGRIWLDPPVGLLDGEPEVVEPGKRT